MTDSQTSETKYPNAVTAFANAIGKTEAEVLEALKPLIGDFGDDSLDLLSSEEYTPFEDIKTAFSGVPAAKLKKAVADHFRPQKAAPQGKTQIEAAAVTPSFDALPPVPEDGTWLASLIAGGELKVDQTTIISAIRAALAARVGLYELPGLLVERMESYAEELDEPVGGDFYKLRKLLTQQSYAEIFSAMEVEGQFVTQGRKNKLLAKLDENLWPALLGFQGQLKGWTESWQQGQNNPAIMMAAMMAVAGGGNGMALPPGVMQPPATDTLRDASQSVIDTINKVFAGTGIPVARALAYDAHRVKQVLDNPSLPAQVGATNREQMLKMLNVAVSADYVRLERNIIRYCLSILELQNLNAGNSELAYLSSLVMLGGQIPWEKLQAPNARRRVAFPGN